jgi:hypothetical protein
LTWAALVALLSVFLGERVLGHLATARWILSGAGTLFFVIQAVWRLVSWKKAEGDDRRVERLLLLGSIGLLGALLVYALGTSRGLGFLGMSLADKGGERVHDATQVLVPLLAFTSLLPMLLAEWASGTRRLGGRAEAYRVVEAAVSGLTIAFAAGMLGLFSFIAAERDVKGDLSYYRTSMPGTATQGMVKSLEQPLRVLLFFPEVNEVKDEVSSYFRSLAKLTGRLEVETYDRMVSPKLAKEYKVSKDGTVVLVHKDKSETIVLDTDLRAAQSSLRVLDEKVQTAFLKATRGQRIAYLTTGHGEMNDPASEGPTGMEASLASTNGVKEVLRILNYQVKELGLKQGLAQDVPDDATVVLSLGPKKALLPEELGALDRYLARGGSVLVALDPTSPVTLGALEARLGVTFDPTPLADDKQHMQRRYNASDNRLIVTDQFSAHASVTTLSRTRLGSGILLVSSGSLSDAPLPAGAEAPKKTYVVRSLSSTFADKNDNNVLDGDEKRSSYNLVAAVEGPKPAPKPDAKPDPKKAPEKGMRALVFADAPMLSDAVLMSVGLNAALFADSIKWLGGEESFIGETTSEKDVEIEHTKGRDLVWFYSTVVGAPFLVLLSGLLSVWWRRRRPLEKQS